MESINIELIFEFLIGAVTLSFVRFGLACTYGLCVSAE